METFDNVTAYNNATEPTLTAPVYLSGLILSIAILGIFDNGLVLIVIAKVPEFRRNMTNILVGHQSLIDFITAVLLLLTFQKFYKRNLDGRYHPVIENFFCKVWDTSFIYWSTYKVSTANLLCVTLERYFALVFPLQYRKHVTRRRIYLVCIFPWIIGPMSEAYVFFIFVVSPATGRETVLK
ncbi:Octopamine receptor beta-2R [Holothuria leucospilota]|uniref:Octopamine receptor beta-2R n=1 Tax=Holothuria leucospilota TaxID=206669 RepID=A0A9Q1BU88_HOLLE|nr:Octopamine receptor beta-2R [Holothuria leucospilota]